MCILAIIIAQIVARPAQAQAAQWSNLATVSNSTSLQAGSLCATDGRDIYCNSSVATLSGLAQADRITSGTAGVYVSDSGIINFRTGDVTTGYFDTAGLLVAPGISVTTANGISSTNGYFSGKLALSAAVPSNTLHVAGTLGVYPAPGQASAPGGGLVIRMNHPATGGYSQMEIAGDRWPQGTGLIFPNFSTAIQASAPFQVLNGLSANVGYFGTSSGAGPSVLLGVNGGKANIVAMNYASSPYPELTLSGPTIHFYTKVNTGWADGNSAATYGTSRLMIAANGNVGIGSSFTSTTTPPSATLHVSGTARLTGWTMVNANATPTAPLEVLGTVSVTDIQLARNATPPAAKCASAADEGRTIMTADGPYVCLMR